MTSMVSGSRLFLYIHVQHRKNFIQMQLKNKELTADEVQTYTVKDKIYFVDSKISTSCLL